VCSGKVISRSMLSWRSHLGDLLLCGSRAICSMSRLPAPFGLRRDRSRSAHDHRYSQRRESAHTHIPAFPRDEAPFMTASMSVRHDTQYAPIALAQQLGKGRPASTGCRCCRAPSRRVGLVV
jgi:hypothetical protein